MYCAGDGGFRLINGAYRHVALETPITKRTRFFVEASVASFLQFQIPPSIGHMECSRRQHQ
jgi:hypothetical protein